MSILDHIKNDEISELHLSCVPDDIFEEIGVFLDVLQKNKSIETVRFDKDFLVCLRNDHRGEVLDVLGKLPRLRKVHIANTLLMIDGITRLLSDAKNLKQLSLEKVFLQGIGRSFEACEAVLHQHTSLKSFSIIDCTTAAVDKSFVDKLLQAGNDAKVYTKKTGTNKFTSLIVATEC